MSEFSESDFLAELKSVVDEIGGKLYITFNNDDMSYMVNYSRDGIPFKISLEALEAVCSTNGPGTLRETLLSATTSEVTKEGMYFQFRYLHNGKPVAKDSAINFARSLAKR